ncbi:hypothetical protein M2167_006119 [Streptomyces sp. SPB4]|nr:hypothetical protein [Streptomyces sp. SPB4]
MGSMTRRQNWTFLTNHARVLVTIARDPAVRLRDVAATCALTERTVQTIVADLESDGYLQRVRDGRRNRYEISPGAVFRHPAEAGVQVAGLLALLTDAPAAPDPLTPDPDGPMPSDPVPPVGATATATLPPDGPDFPAAPAPPDGPDLPVAPVAPVDPAVAFAPAGPDVPVALAPHVRSGHGYRPSADA